jgi:hypothetical protein
VQAEAGGGREVYQRVEREFVELAAHQAVEAGARHAEARGRFLLRKAPHGFTRSRMERSRPARVVMLAASNGLSARASKTLLQLYALIAELSIP